MTDGIGMDSFRLIVTIEPLVVITHANVLQNNGHLFCGRCLLPFFSAMESMLQISTGQLDSPLLPGWRMTSWQSLSDPQYAIVNF